MTGNAVSGIVDFVQRGSVEDKLLVRASSPTKGSGAVITICQDSQLLAGQHVLSVISVSLRPFRRSGGCLRTSG